MSWLKSRPADLICLLVFGVVTLITMLSHELAHDEATAWNIARSADHWLQVFWHSRHEGHSPFWFLVLWPLTLTGNPMLMQGFSWFVGVAVAALLLKERPFPLWICVVLIFGYYILYEYTIISRPYILALLFCALLASSLHRQSKALVWQCTCCGLIAFTSAFGVALSVPLILLVISNSYRANSPITRSTVVSGLIIYAAFFIVCLLCVVLPLDRTEQVMGGVHSSVANQEKVNLWLWLRAWITPVFPHIDRLPLGLGDFLRNQTRGVVLIAMVAMLAVLSVGVQLRRYPDASRCWLLSVVVVPLAIVFSGSESERHLGHLYLAALTLLWAKKGLYSRQRVGSSGDIKTLMSGVSSVFLVTVLCYQSVIGVAVTAFDLSRELTIWRELSQEISKTPEHEEALLLTNQAQHVSSLLAYLDKEAFDVRCQCWTRYGRWNPGTKISQSDILESWCDMNNKPVLAILSGDEWKPIVGIEQLANYSGRGFRDDVTFGGPYVLRMTDMHPCRADGF